MKTKKQLTDELTAAGVTVPPNANLAALQELAQSNGIAIELPEEKPEENDSSGSTEEAVAGSDYDPGRIITPVMAVVGMSGPAAALPESIVEPHS